LESVSRRISFPPDVLFDKSIFSAKDARRMHQKHEEKDFIAANTRSHRHATAPSETDSLATSQSAKNQPSQKE